MGCTACAVSSDLCRCIPGKALGSDGNPGALVAIIVAAGDFIARIFQTALVCCGAAQSCRVRRAHIAMPRRTLSPTTIALSPHRILFLDVVRRRGRWRICGARCAICLQQYLRNFPILVCGAATLLPGAVRSRTACAVTLRETWPLFAAFAAIIVFGCSSARSCRAFSAGHSGSPWFCWSGISPAPEAAAVFAAVALVFVLTSVCAGARLDARRSRAELLRRASGHSVG